MDFIIVLLLTGQMIDGPSNGPAPGPWDMQCTPPAKFKNHTAAVEVPHTASVKVRRLVVMIAVNILVLVPKGVAFFFH